MLGWGFLDVWRFNGDLWCHTYNTACTGLSMVLVFYVPWWCGLPASALVFPRIQSFHFD